MSYFTRFTKAAEKSRHYDGTFTQATRAAPPKHMRDKNRSHSGQGAHATSIPSQEGALGQQQNDDDAPLDNDTTNQ